MADAKITDLAALSSTDLADGDLFVVVDVSDTSMAATGTNKKILLSSLLAAIQRRDFGIDYWSVVGGLLP